MKRGQILTELLIALGVTTVAVVALVQIATKSLSNAGFSRRQSNATGYAVAATEWLRTQRQTLGWDAFALKANQTYCLNALTWNAIGICGSAQIDATGFAREATLTSVSNREIDAMITVSWQEGSKTFSSKQTTIFTRY